MRIFNDVGKVRISPEELEDSSKPIELFRSSLRSSSATLEEYEIYLKKFVVETLDDILVSDGFENRVNEFVNKAKSDEKFASKVLVALVTELRKKTELGPQNPDYIKPRTIHNWINAIKKLLDMNEIPIVWKKIRSMIPPEVVNDNSRGWKKDEIEKMLRFARADDRCAILIACSSGIRLGAFAFCWKDVRPVYHYNGKYLFEDEDVTESVEKNGKIVCGMILIYGDSKERYFAFITPETLNAVSDYKEKWIQEIGRPPRDEEPFFRAYRIFIKGGVIRTLSESGLADRINLIAREAGLRNPLVKGKKRHEVPLMNGFRRFLNKQMKSSKSKNSTLAELIFSERLMGHGGLIPLDYNYFKSNIVELIEQYLVAIPNLTISKEMRQKEIIKQQNEEINELKKRELEIESLKAQQLESKREMLSMFSNLVDDPEKFKEILKKSKSETKN